VLCVFSKVILRNYRCHFLAVCAFSPSPSLFKQTCEFLDMSDGLLLELPYHIGVCISMSTHVCDLLALLVALLKRLCPCVVPRVFRELFLKILNVSCLKSLSLPASSCA
jgi:hypothetical protein